MTPTDERWRRQFVQELFHRLGQPITALHGTLELALRKTLSPDEYREVLKQALELTALLVGITISERELADSTDPGEVRSFDLVELARNVLDDVETVAKDAGIAFTFEEQGTALIRADPRRIGFVLSLFLSGCVESNRGLDELLLFVGKTNTRVFAYVGPPVSGVFCRRNEIASWPFAPPERMLINVLKAVGGHLAVLRTVDFTKFILEFPADRASTSVSASLAANFSK